MASSDISLFDFLEKPRPTIELTSSMKAEYIICKDLTVGTTRSANGPTPGEVIFHGEVIFPVCLFSLFDDRSSFRPESPPVPVSTHIKIVFRS